MIKKNEVENIVETIRKNYPLDKILLFGSYARNEQNVNSDLDLLIISDYEKNLPRYRRGLKLRILLTKFQISKDILIYTNDEIKEWKDIPNSFINTVISDGSILYG